MARANFHYDIERRCFTVEVAVSLASPVGDPAQTIGNWIPLKMVVDSGSNQTSVAEEIAEALGLNPERMERQPVGGITGVGMRPFFNDAIIWLLTGELSHVALDKVIVLDTSVARVEKKRGTAIRKTQGLASGTSIFGMDIPRKLGGRLILDFKSLRGHMEW